ncbi:MAG: rhodanese-related sulfurtransferase [Bacteroidota bacterium]
MKKLYNRVNNDELKQLMLQKNEERVTLSFYQYAHIEQVTLFRNEFYQGLQQLGVFGRIYVAKEGINGQISVLAKRLEELRNYLYSIDFLEGIRLNIAIEDDGKSFYKLKIKVRDKIVADGLDDRTFDATKRGTPLDAADFNELVERDETIIVDMRNHYESEVGYFKGAILPDIETFREALPLVEDMLKEKKDQHIVMYCTGGIRCEKASAYYLHKGFENIYMVEGGIIEYTRQCEAEGLENKFIGKNFVFDERMSERISEEVIAKCHQCGKPCDTHTNCANDACHILFIQCEECAAKYESCCSRKCADFKRLPAKQQLALRKTIVFNGMKFGKGRYKAFYKDESLEIE